MALDKFRSSANRLNIPEIVSEPVLYVFKNATCSFSVQCGMSCSNSFVKVVLCKTGYEVLLVDIERSVLELIHGSTEPGFVPVVISGSPISGSYSLSMSDVGGQHCPSPVLVSLSGFCLSRFCPLSGFCPEFSKKRCPLSGQTRTRQSCSDFRCPCPPTFDHCVLMWNLAFVLWMVNSGR